MFFNKSDLLNQINSIISENKSKEKLVKFDFSSIQKAMEAASDPGLKNHSPFFRSQDVKKLEDRMKKLEEQNDQLSCIVHFLFDRISILTKNLFELSKGQEEQKCCPVNAIPESRMRTVAFNSQDKCRPALTKREMDVFDLLAKGLCAKEIAKTLFISETTVITHKRNLKEKFHARNTVELISNVLNNQSA